MEPQGADRFSIERELTDTLQGRVYAGTDRVTNKPAVIKEAWRQLVHTGYSRKGHRVPEDFLAERRLVMTLSQLDDCQGIARGLGEWEDEHCYYYAMEHCEAELFDHISKHHQSARHRRFVKAEEQKEQIAVREPTEWTQTVASMFKQICETVQWMHSKGYCHLDLSLENTMISDLSQLKVKIIDLGLTKHFPNGDFRCGMGRVGKLQYMCPEAYARQEFDARKADVYCLGVMLFMMLIGAPPYTAPQTQNAAFRYIISGKLEDVLRHWKRLRLLTEDAVDLLNKILCYERDRISVDQILEHPFLANRDGINDDEKKNDEQPSNPIVSSLDSLNKEVSNMSIEDESHGVKQQSGKPVIHHAMDHKEESGGGHDHNPRNDNQQRQKPHAAHPQYNVHGQAQPHYVHNDNYPAHAQGHYQGHYAPNSHPQGGYQQAVHPQGPYQGHHAQGHHNQYQGHQQGPYPQGGHQQDAYQNHHVNRPNHSHHAVEQKEQSMGDNGASLCEQLLSQWGLMQIYDALHATDWDRPAEWDQLTVYVLEYECGVPKELAKRFIKCYSAHYGGGNHPHNNGNQSQQ